VDNMIFTSEVCGVVLIAPFDKISRPPCSTIRFIVFLSLFFRCFSPFSFYHRTFSLTVPFIDDIAEGRKLVVTLSAVHTIIHRNKVNIMFGKHDFRIHADLQIITSET